MGIIHNLIGVSVFWKVQIQPDIASDSTDGEIICMYKSVKKQIVIWRYMEALAIQTGAPIVHWEDNTSSISVVESKIVTPIFKHINIPVCFLQDKFNNGLFTPKYEKYSVIMEGMCTKPCSGPIISRSTK